MVITHLVLLSIYKWDISAAKQWYWFCVLEPITFLVYTANILQEKQVRFKDFPTLQNFKKYEFIKQWFFLGIGFTFMQVLGECQPEYKYQLLGVAVLFLYYKYEIKKYKNKTNRK